MTANTVKAREARELWATIKSAAIQRGPTLLDGLASIALDTWATTDAGTKLSEDRQTREAFVASLVGAAVVDASLDKLAAEGAYTTPEVEFLRDINAEAALRDLARFQKNANYAHDLLALLKAHPAAAGAAAGGMAGAGFGAYSDDENRLRGALRFAVPGAAMGAMLGYGGKQLHTEALESEAAALQKAIEATRAQDLHTAKMEALANQAKPRVRSELELARDAELHEARLRLMDAQTEAARRAHKQRWR